MTARDSDAKPAGDLKVLRNLREARPLLSILPYNGEVYGSRGLEYGADKYARGNYFGPPPANVDPVERFLEYMDAAKRHIGKICQAVNIAKGTGGDQRAACGDLDTEASGGFPPSMLPHIAHAIAGLLIAVECGINDGLLPLDPGQPWKKHPDYAGVLDRRGAQAATLAALVQKDDPDAERKRVELAQAKRNFQDAAGQVVPEVALYGAPKPPAEAVPEKIDDVPPPVSAMSAGGLPG